MAWQRATQTAQRQFGVIARRQLLAASNTRSRIEHWQRAGRLHRVYPGVYALGRRELSAEGETAAALLHGGAGAALAGVSALWWLGLLHRRPDPVHVATPGRARARIGVRVTHVPGLRRRWHRGLPVVALAEALLAAAAGLSRDSLRLVLARAEFERVLDRSELEAMLRSGRPGVTALRAAVESHLPALGHCANGFERDFVLLCERHSLPIPEPNVRIGRFRPDMLWRDAMLIAEIDGRDAHSTPAQLAADARRQTELEGRGYAVVRCTATAVRAEPERIAAELRQRLR